jgi:alanine racemase
MDTNYSLKSCYRAQADVNLDAIKHNISQVRAMLSNGTKLMVIVKADAYGHGAVPVARALDEQGADAYGVAILEEAIELREAGIEKPILVLGYTSKEQYAMLVTYGVTQTVFCYDMAKALSDEASGLGKKAKVHIKVDTGMSRIGYPDTQEGINEIKRIAKLPGIEIEGIFSHFAKADECDQLSIEKQLKRFLSFCEMLKKEGIDIPVKHISNSAGAINDRNADLNMIRCGICTYGIYPSREISREGLDLIPAMEIRSHVIFVKDVEAGTGISYGSTYVTKTRTRVATIPLGYADGYSWNLSNCGKVIIHGQYAPILGRVCMDQFMVDVTHIKDVKPGDTVTLLGRDQDAYISVEELSKWSHSFPYELICTVGKRIPRVYHCND